MDLLCKVCDKEFIENETEYKIYTASLHKKDDKIIYNKYVINNSNLDEFDSRLSDYVCMHNKKFNTYFTYCEFKMQFDNISTRHLKTELVHNIEFEKIYQTLIYCIEYLESKG